MGLHTKELDQLRKNRVFAAAEIDPDLRSQLDTIGAFAVGHEGSIEPQSEEVEENSIPLYEID
jgi:hypothetical protein